MQRSGLLGAIQLQKHLLHYPLARDIQCPLCPAMYPSALEDVCLCCIQFKCMQPNSDNILSKSRSLLQDVQAQSTSLEAQVSAEKETSRKLKEHSQTLEAELLVETERALSAEEEADCLEVELVEAKAKADTSQEHLRVGSKSPVYCKHVKSSGPAICLLVCQTFLCFYLSLTEK